MYSALTPSGLGVEAAEHVAVGRTDTMFDCDAWLRCALAPQHYPGAVRVGANLARPVVTQVATMRDTFTSTTGKDVKVIFTPENRRSNIIRIMEWDESLTNPGWATTLPGILAAGRFKTMRVIGPTISLPEKYDLVMWNGFMGEAKSTSAAISNGGTVSGSISNDPHSHVFAVSDQVGSDGIAGMVVNSQPALEGVAISTLFSGDAEMKPPIPENASADLPVVANSADVERSFSWSRVEGQPDGNGWVLAPGAVGQDLHWFDTDRFTEARQMYNNLTGSFSISVDISCGTLAASNETFHLVLTYDDGTVDDRIVGAMTTAVGNVQASMSGTQVYDVVPYVIRIELVSVHNNVPVGLLKTGRVTVSQSGYSYGEGMQPLTWETVFTGLDTNQNISTYFYGSFTAVPNRELSKYVTSYVNASPLHPFLAVSAELFRADLTGKRPIMNAAEARRWTEAYTRGKLKGLRYEELLNAHHQAGGFGDFMRSVAHGLGSVLSTGSAILSEPARAMAMLPGPAGAIAKGVTVGAPIAGAIGDALQKAEGYDGLAHRARNALHKAEVTERRARDALDRSVRQSAAAIGAPVKGPSKKAKQRRGARGRGGAQQAAGYSGGIRALGECYFPSVNGLDDSALNRLTVTAMNSRIAPVTGQVEVPVRGVFWILPAALVGHDAERVADVEAALNLLAYGPLAESSSVVVTVQSWQFTADRKPRYHPDGLEIEGPSWALALCAAVAGATGAVVATGGIGACIVTPTGAVAGVQMVAHLHAKHAVVMAAISAGILPADPLYLRPFSVGAPDVLVRAVSTDAQGVHLRSMKGAAIRLNGPAVFYEEAGPSSDSAVLPSLPAADIAAIIAAFPAEALEALAQADMAPVLYQFLATLDERFSAPEFAGEALAAAIAQYPDDPHRQVLAQLLMSLAGIAGLGVGVAPSATAA